MENIEKTIIYDGKRFTLCEGKKYHYNSSVRRHLHQYIWEEANGAIPEGWEVHHKDLNPYNNDLSNLEAMPAEEHRAIHRELNKNNPERMAFWRDNLNEKARPKACEWHGSEAGIAWHKEHYERMKDKLHQTITIKCDCCGEEAVVPKNKRNRFCSNRCKSKWRRDNGLDNITKTCLVCNKEYVTNKYSKTKACSRSCASKLRGKDVSVIKVCLVCGNEFTTSKYNETRTCSRSCSGKLGAMIKNAKEAN